MHKMVVRLGVPKLGIITYVCDLDVEGDRQALDMNIANGCSLLSMQPYPELKHLQDLIKLSKFD